VQLTFSDTHANAARELVRMALGEDLGADGDVTTLALIPERQTGSVQIVARAAGVLAGLPVAIMVFMEIDPAVDFAPMARDGDSVAAGQVIAEISGSLRSLLTGERTCLNFLTHLSGVATLTHRYVDAVAGTFKAASPLMKFLCMAQGVPF
jgi:nicotinate-nucleotide pyrophosphorylase (carboxylating)